MFACGQMGALRKQKHTGYWRTYIFVADEFKVGDERGCMNMDVTCQLTKRKQQSAIPCKEKRKVPFQELLFLSQGPNWAGNCVRKQPERHHNRLVMSLVLRCPEMLIPSPKSALTRKRRVSAYVGSRQGEKVTLDYIDAPWPSRVTHSSLLSLPLLP